MKQTKEEKAAYNKKIKLTEEERKERRKQSAKNCYLKNREINLEKERKKGRDSYYRNKEKNLEKERERGRDRYYKNIEKEKLRSKLKYEKNKEKWKENDRKKYEENPELLLIKKEKNRIYKRKRRLENKEKINEENRLWRLKPESKIKRNIRDKKNSSENILYKTTRNIRSLISYAFELVGSKKNVKVNPNNKTFIILGCSVKEFKEYIEQQFEEWMNWNNYGINKKIYNHTWQYDHIVPIGICETEDEIKLLSYYLNWRPFCALKNNEKLNKIDLGLIDSRKELKEYLIKNNFYDRILKIAEC